jgi:D-amino peptidase
MKILISADMEGATGIVRWPQVEYSDKEYAFGRKMQLHDVRAVVSGALDAGADEILINDSHDRMINLDASELGFDSRVHLLSGSPKRFSMVEGFRSADAAFFVGYHAKAGTPRAILDHTMSEQTVHSAFLNDMEVGETGLNAAVCAQRKIPLALVTGDAAVCAEAGELMGDALVTASVKEAYGRMAADCLLPEESWDLLSDAAMRAVERVRAGTAPTMNIGDGRFDLRMTFHNSAQCDRAAIVPGAERQGGLSVRVTGQDMTTMMRWVVTLVSISSI